MFVALVLVCFSSNVSNDESAKKLVKHLDIKPMYFFVYNQSVFLVGLGATITYRSVCGSEMYMRRHEEICYIARSTGFIVFTFIGVILLYFRKAMLVKTGKPKIKLKWKVLAKFVRSSMAMESASGDSGEEQASRRKAQVCCFGLCDVGEEDEQDSCENVHDAEGSSSDLPLPASPSACPLSDIVPTSHSSMNPMNVEM
jgi:hypothetical protein